jgi:RHS repeat-associated protein
VGDLLTRIHGPSGETLTLDHARWARVNGVRLADGMGQTISEANYAFAMNGWRIKAQRDGVQRNYVHDGPNATVGLDDAGNVAWRRLHTRSVDRALAEERDGQLRWLLADHVGSVRDVVDNNGLVLARYSYDPFGRQVSGPAPTLDDSLRFTGREFDLPGGLGFYRARVYDPAIGRFVSEDARAPWHYAYAENNPLVLVDPSGESAATEYAMVLCTVSATVFGIRPWALFVDSALTQAANGLQGLPASAGAALAPLEPTWIDPIGPFLPCGLGGPLGDLGGG